LDEPSREPCAPASTLRPARSQGPQTAARSSSALPQLPDRKSRHAAWPFVLMAAAPPPPPLPPSRSGIPGSPEPSRGGVPGSPGPSRGGVPGSPKPSRDGVPGSPEQSRAGVRSSGGPSRGDSPLQLPLLLPPTVSPHNLLTTATATTGAPHSIAIPTPSTTTTTDAAACLPMVCTASEPPVRSSCHSHRCRRIVPLWWPCT
jgi:hypothetical protein